MAAIVLWSTATRFADDFRRASAGVAIRALIVKMRARPRFSVGKKHS
jgi:hypothetical protein